MTGPPSAANPETRAADPAAVRAALARILVSRAFECCDAQARLLRAAVENRLSGRRFTIKPGPAGKLRARLAEYYAAEGARDPVRIEIPADGAPAAFSTVEPPAHPPKRRWWILGPVVLATLAIIWAGSLLHARMASAQVRSLAILPLADLTPGHDDWFAPSFTGDVMDDLARAPGLDVVARTSALRASGDPRRQFAVTAVVQGSLRRQGRDLHISLEMIRTSDGYRLWSARLDRPAGDLPAARDAVTAAIAARLQVRLPAPPPHPHSPSAEAYRAYLQGRYFFDRADPEALDRAARLLEDSTRLDPNFARAWAWLSIVRGYRVAAAMAKPNRAMPASRDAAERAAALDPDSGDAHLALGIVKLQYDWDWAGAKAELDRALAAIPGSAFALEWRARWLRIQGRSREAIAEIEHALQLDPLCAALLRDAAAGYLALQQPDRAVAYARKAVERNPEDAAARVALAGVLLAAGQKEESRQVVEELRQSPAGAKLPPSVLPLLAARLGDPQDARQLLDRAEDLPDDELLPAVAYAELAASIQDWDRLFSWTEEAFGERDVELPYWRESPLIPKADPRFDAFLAEMNLPAPASR